MYVHMYNYDWRMFWHFETKIVESKFDALIKHQGYAAKLSWYQKRDLRLVITILIGYHESLKINSCLKKQNSLKIFILALFIINFENQTCATVCSLHSNVDRSLKACCCLSSLNNVTAWQISQQ